MITYTTDDYFDDVEEEINKHWAAKGIDLTFDVTLGFSAILSIVAGIFVLVGAVLCTVGGLTRK